jgi:hypothetical protein
MRYLLIFFLSSCAQQSYFSSNKIIVYKTKENYRKNVAVSINREKNEVLNYPDPSDIAKHKPLPIKLKSKYLLDCRGIDTNTAFLQLTYKQYAKLNIIPSDSFILSNLIPESKPIIEFHVIAKIPSAKNLKKNLNKRIVNGTFK